MSHVTGWLLLSVWLLAVVTHALPIERLELKRFIHQSPINGPRVEQSIHENQFEAPRFKRSIPEGYQYKKHYKDIVNQFEAPRFKRFIPESPFEAQEFKRSIPESAFEEQEFKRSIPEFYRPEQGRFALVAYPPEQSIVIGADAVFAGMQKRLTEITRQRRAAPKGYYSDGIVSSFEVQRLKRSIPQSPFEGQRLRHSMLDKGVHINPKHSELGIVLTGLTRERRAASEAEGQYDDDGIVSSFKAERSKRSIPTGFQPEKIRANNVGVYISPIHSELGILNVRNAVLAGMKKQEYLLPGLTRAGKATAESQLKAKRSKRFIPKAEEFQRKQMRASIVNVGDATGMLATIQEPGYFWSDIHRQRRATGSEDVRDFVGAERKNLRQNSASKGLQPEKLRASIVNVGDATGMLAAIQEPGYFWSDIHRQRRATGSEDVRNFVGAVRKNLRKNSALKTGDAVFAEMEKRGSPGIVSSVFKRQVQPVFKEKD